MTSDPGRHRARAQGMFKQILKTTCSGRYGRLEIPSVVLDLLTYGLVSVSWVQENPAI